MSDAPTAPSTTSRKAPAIFGGVLAGFALLYGGLILTSGGDVPRNTTVRGVEIGGLDRAAAVTALQRGLAERAAAPLSVVAAGKSLRVQPEPAGLSLDAEATVDAAGGRSLNPWTLIARLFGGSEVEPVVAVDRALLAEAVAGLAEQVDEPVREGAVTFVAAKPVAVQPLAGRALDRIATATAIEDHFLRDGAATAPVGVVEPSIDQAELQRALTGFARPAVAGPVTLVIAGRPIVLTPAQFAPFLSMTAKGGVLVPAIDAVGLRAALAGRAPDLLVAPRDAGFRIVSGRPVVVPAVSGRSLDEAGLSAAMLTVLPKPTARTVTVQLAEVEPELTTAEAQALGVKERLSTFTQPFPYAAYRKTNIGTAARRIDGTLLMPGETYSQNATVKERTAANGYVKGTIIDDGRFREDFGGGVSTITTALWHAVFYAGLERVEQRAHSFFIPRYQAGLEATVSWGNLDLRFRNDSPYGVYIQAVSGSTFVTISIFSTKRYDISAVSGPRTNVRAPRTIYDAKAGCLPQSGEPGFSIVVTRVFSQNGTVVKREPLVTNYNVQNRVICRAAPRPTPAPSASGSPAPSGSARPSASPTPTPTG